MYIISKVQADKNWRENGEILVYSYIYICIVSTVLPGGNHNVRTVSLGLCINQKICILVAV